MFYTYVLKSSVTGELYTGSTRDRVQRLGQHNAGLVRSTKHARPWEMVHWEAHETRSRAVRREHFFKSGCGRMELKKLLAQELAPEAKPLGKPQPRP
jgi:putative endonuclease